MIFLIFFETKLLLPGMSLGRDIHFFNSIQNKMVELKKDVVLTELDILSFKSSNIEGAYIEQIPEKIELKDNIKKQVKLDAIAEITLLAQSFAYSPEGIQLSQIKAISDTSKLIVSGVANEKNAMINIFNLKKYDDYTYYHSLSVSLMALAIGMELGLDNATLQELVLSGMLHDIGKLTIPIEIINKPTKLTREEFEIVKLHPVNAGIHLLKKNFVSENTFRGILGHHEKWDGTGYPNGIAGNDISLFARILTVADVYDALTSYRPYRVPSNPSEAIEYIMGGSGTLFDVDIVKAFLRRISPYPVGINVKLSNGEFATVIKDNIAQPLRPIVKVVGTQKIYDLYNDFSKLSIIISGLANI